MTICGERMVESSRSEDPESERICFQQNLDLFWGFSSSCSKLDLWEYGQVCRLQGATRETGPRPGPPPSPCMHQDISNGCNGSQLCQVSMKQSPSKRCSTWIFHNNEFGDQSNDRLVSPQHATRIDRGGVPVKAGCVRTSLAQRFTDVANYGAPFVK